MTNHPRRQRDENDPAPIEAQAAEPDAPPAHTGNGIPPGFQPNAARLIGQAVAESLAQILPNLLGAVLSQVPIRALTQQHVCAPCLTRRLDWERAHHDDMDAAMTAAAEAAGVEPGSPQAAQVDIGAFLPENLRPGGPAGIPGIAQAVTSAGGTEVCPEHIAGAQGGGRLLAAQMNVNPAALGQLAGR